MHSMCCRSIYNSFSLSHHEHRNKLSLLHTARQCMHISRSNQRSISVCVESAKTISNIERVQWTIPSPETKKKIVLSTISNQICFTSFARIELTQFKQQCLIAQIYIHTHTTNKLTIQIDQRFLFPNMVDICELSKRDLNTFVCPVVSFKKTNYFMSFH